MADLSYLASDIAHLFRETCRCPRSTKALGCRTELTGFLCEATFFFSLQYRLPPLTRLALEAHSSQNDVPPAAKGLKGTHATVASLESSSRRCPPRPVLLVRVCRAVRWDFRRADLGGVGLSKVHHATISSARLISSGPMSGVGTGACLTIKDHERVMSRS